MSLRSISLMAAGPPVRYPDAGQPGEAGAAEVATTTQQGQATGLLRHTDTKRTASGTPAASGLNR